MVDSILAAEAMNSRTSFTVRTENIFVQDGVFTEPGLVENMAQTAAAGTGYRYQQKGEKVPVGFIGSIKGLKIHSLPVVGDVLETETSIVHTVLNVHMVQATIKVAEQVIASCEMKIFEQPEPPVR